MATTRRDMMIALGWLMAASTVSSATAEASAPRIRKPPRLRAGDTVGLIEPATPSDEAFDVTLAEEAMTAMGLRPKRGAHVQSRYGYFAGNDRERAADVNAMFADPEVRAIFAVRGGWGCARILPFLDWKMIAARPKLLIGFSDITALHLAIAAKAGFVSLHGPNASSAWGKASLESFRQIAFDAATPTFQNPVATDDRLVQKKWRARPIRGGTARGRLIGGNLTVLTSLVGTPYLPDLTGAILFIEDIDEAEYRIDRMLTQLGQAGILKGLAGVAFGQCTNCRDLTPEGTSGFTLTDILDQHIGALGIPAFQGAFFGHIADQFSMPIGVHAEIDAHQCTIRLLEAAVA